MLREKKPLSVKLKGDEVTIKFNAKSWKPADSRLIELLGDEAYNSNTTSVEEHVKLAFWLLGKKTAQPDEDFEGFVESLDYLN